MNVRNWFRRTPYKRTVRYWKNEAESLQKEKTKLSNQVREKQAKIDRLKRQVRKLERRA